MRHITHVVNFDVPARRRRSTSTASAAPGRAGDAGDAMVFMSPEESAILTRVERQLKVRLPRKVLPDFDYEPPPPPKRPPVGNGNGTGAKPRRQPVGAGVGGYRKPSRGQGRR